MASRTRPFVSIISTSVVVAATVLFVYWALNSPLQVQRFLVRLVLISLILFLAILFVRYFTLL